MMKNESYEFLRGYENNHINIGFGSYGQVKLARNTETKDLVAIKLVQCGLTQIYNKNAKDEIALHKRLDHPSIVKLLNYYYEEKKNITYMVL
jgi:serine/threonine-protein kinase Chk1